MLLTELVNVHSPSTTTREEDEDEGNTPDETASSESRMIGSDINWCEMSKTLMSGGEYEKQAAE